MGLLETPRTSELTPDFDRDTTARHVRRDMALALELAEWCAGHSRYWEVANFESGTSWLGVGDHGGVDFVHLGEVVNVCRQREQRAR